MKNIDNKLDLLKQIKEVDAPPFLLTRIRQGIDNLHNAEAPVKWKWAFAIISIFLLLLNLSIFFKTPATTNKKAGIESLVTTLNLSTSNSLYNE